MTTADVKTIDGGAILHKDGQMLHLRTLSHPEANVSTVSLDPPPLKTNLRIKGLKQLEINIPVNAARDGRIQFTTQLVGEEL